MTASSADETPAQREVRLSNDNERHVNRRANQKLVECENDLKCRREERARFLRMNWDPFRDIVVPYSRKGKVLDFSALQRLHNYDDEVRGLFSDFKALFDKVVYDDPGTDYDETEACSMQDEISDLYISLISDLKIVLPAKTKEVTPPTQPSLRLPKFELPKFSGNYEEWSVSNDSTPTQQQPSYPTKVFEKKYGKPPTNNAPQSHVTAPVNKSALVGLSSQLNPTKTTILLGTCLVQVFSKDGQQTVLRAVLDSASQLTLISERAVQLISASRTRAHDEIQGISGSLIHSRGIVHIDISAVNGQRLAYHHPCLVLNRITSPLPQVPVSPQVKGSLNDFVLADPCFDKPGEIDLLIGADLFALSLTGEQHFLGHNLPQVLGTIFGFVVMGIAPVATSELSIPKTVSFLTTHDGDLHSSLQRFWSIEEPPTCVKTQSEEDVLCLQHFERTHTRDNSGRYVVKLPKRPNHPLLGESCSTAQLRLKAMERKFAAQPEFKDLYSEFMDDYIKSGHMSACEQPISGECYYLPHHGVFKENPPNSKIRVVFDGSSKTNNGVSLNDILMPGPKLQNDISDVLLYFRCHKFVFTCDIRQMYRQILVAEDDKKYQLIFWRSNPDESLQVLKLNTVTYGLNCSPFIAIRTLQQLVKDEGHSYPKASEILTKSIFYDDIIAGAESLDEALSAQNELKNLLSRGGFELRKWISNAPQLLDQVPIEHKETPVELTENSEAFFSVLGLKWTPESDMLSYKVKDVEISAILTKRRILSTIAKLYDLPGFLTPVIFWAKTLIQYLWTTGLTWDEPVPNDVRTKWHSFLEELPIIQELRIPRYISTSLHTAVQLHGFSDASEKGYTAVVYLRVTDSQENTRLYLIVSKSKVAPLKRIYLPRLELCGAHLLGKLLQYSSNILSAHMKIESIYAWCDSTIVLTWIRTLPYRLKVFIANRISELQELVSPHSWNYVKSQDNPADCATRGLSPSQIVTHHLWWNGPEWLQSSSDSWPKPKFTPVIDDDTLEIRPNPLNVLATTEKIKLTDFDILEKYSCFRKLVNVMAYILRFIHNLQANDSRIGRLTCQEISSAKLRIFKLIQNTSFKDYISALKKGSQCSLKLARLSPYIDDSGIVRVGGRLKHSNLTQDAKHPVLLPKSHCAVKLLIMHYHLKHLHAGPQLLQSILSQEVWILSARSVIRSVIFKCQRCFRLKPVNKPPLMGDLPETRLKPVRPFYHTGMDYSGHFDIKVHSTRNAQRLKSYLCLFVCFATKAVHLEIVTDLSVDSFIAALKRFVSRRGLCAHLYSDCGTNYVGASKQLMKTFQNFMKESNTKDALNNFALDHSINFHFQPPAAPHQGGLWESAIKSSKYHLKRVIGDRVLTLMEIITLATQVEAVLNSRPLTALSADPSDISALTPGHFLIGTSLVAVPEPNLEEVPENRLNHWQTVQALHQRFWQRWHQEYLHQLQQRKKWEKPNKNLEVGDLVIIQDPRTPPLLWPLGRIVKTSPGSDGIVRVVTIKTQRGTFCRPATKVYPLP
ncbi:uncharacterized protein LOC128984491 [Macrosteles quadrilineatus]|uniref:uncharacterized protein LOC128984491 n=1 Tax=Macrosteles quadrilineatus TaxID=74068 RepID=UPI0023E1AB00|nr:uncharacterized protein LOC128984491 [Macrosteles quadrilineatus]